MEQISEEFGKSVDVQDAGVTGQDIIDRNTNEGLEISDHLNENPLDLCEDGGHILHGAPRGTKAL